MSRGKRSTGRAFETDLESWERLAQQEPFWAVLAREELRGATPTADAIGAFWRSGNEHVAHVLAVVRNEIDPSFAPHVAVDFGCGVGRNLVPLAQRSDHVLGLDASPTMIEKASARLAECGVENARALVTGRQIEVEAVTGLGPVDFVHSVLVFQHIVPSEGARIFGQLLDVLTPGGFGFFQFRGKNPGGELEGAVRALRFRHGWFNVLAERSRISLLNRVVMLYEYDVLELLGQLSAHRISTVVLEQVDVGRGGYEARFYFRKDVRSEEDFAKAGRPLEVRLRP
jgi:SAM-dependent methyltransferase